MSKLTSIALSQPHAAYAAFTHGFRSKWSYLCWTIPDVGRLLQPLEDTLRTKFIPALTGRPDPSDLDRASFALPTRLGGLGLVNPTELDDDYIASLKITSPLKEHILTQEFEYSFEVFEEQVLAKQEVHKLNRERSCAAAADLKLRLSPVLQHAVDLAQEKGASNWLTALPIEEHGFSLHKSAFRDALALRYGWLPLRSPSSCACGNDFSVEHMLSCSKGGFPSLRHNEIRDLTADLMSEVCHEVCIEPHLQPITGETFSNVSAITDAGARLDIAAQGFWGSNFERAFFDVRVFNPFAPSNRLSSFSSTYAKHENEKKRAYEQRVREVEHGSFTPLVMSSTGGLGRASTSFYKRLASLIAEKRDHPYSKIMAWLRCRLCFSLLRSSIRCIRGTRSAMGRPYKCGHAPIDLIAAESQLSMH